MRKKRTDTFEDDGRVVAPMNVEGMPWHTPEREPRQTGDSSDVPVKLTRQENMAFSFGVLKAVLLVTFAYIGALFAFILFCIHIWLR